MRGRVTLTLPGEALAAALSGVQEARYTQAVGEERHRLAEAALILADAANAWDIAGARDQQRAAAQLDHEGASE